jgi:DNA-binding CsgD family transcriptional regulator
MKDLTYRQMEVMKLMSFGYSDAEIGRVLGISPLTVRTHITDSLRRLHVHTRAHAVGKLYRSAIELAGWILDEST